MREVDLPAFAVAFGKGAMVIDVRETYEYVAGHVPGARLVSMAQLPSAAPDLPRGVPVYLICATGRRSLAAASSLARAGVDAWSVAGGTAAWRRAGHPVIRGREPASA